MHTNPSPRPRSSAAGRKPPGAVTLVVAAVLAGPAMAMADEPCHDRGLPPQALVANARAAGDAFAPVDLLGARRPVDAAVQSVVRQGSMHKVDPAVHAWLRAEAPRTFTLPVRSAAGRLAELELVQVDILTPDFTVVTSDSNGRPVPYERGLHYRGTVRGEPGSLAALSVFEDEVAGTYRTAAEGTVVIGRMGGKNPGGDHIVYAARDLTGMAPHTCATQDDPATDPEFTSFQAFQLEDAPPATPTILARCVRIYVEVDQDLATNKGGVTGATNYLTAVFNQSATLYANDSVPISLSQVFVWTSNSPYAGINSSGALLRQFQSVRNSFNGDLGHLVALRGGGGIAAGFNGFCNANIDSRQCFSGLQATFNNVPTYSWTVEVFTHEMGHLMGSRHTQACVWNGNNTAIDGCAAPEGSCPRPGLPAGGGTIMSYCHQQQSVGINFNNGFGPQPGNVIRNRFASASCLQDCGGGGGGGTDVFFDDFETDRGWTRNPSGTDTATLGLWERGDPSQTTSGSSVMQLGATTSGSNNLSTGRLAGSSVGAADVDGGVTSIQSPAIALPSGATLTLSFQFYMAHLNNASAADFFRVSLVGSSGTTQVFQEVGAANTDVAAFASQSFNITSFAGQTVRILVQAADASTGSLVEAAVDDVRITRQ